MKFILTFILISGTFAMFSPVVESKDLSKAKMKKIQYEYDYSARTKDYREKFTKDNGRKPTEKEISDYTIIRWNGFVNILSGKKWDSRLDHIKFSLSESK